LRHGRREPRCDPGLTTAALQQALERLEVTRGPERRLESPARLRRELDLEAEAVVLSTWSGEQLGGELCAQIEGALRGGRETALRVPERRASAPLRPG
jgi:hypothetical protein